VLSYARLKSDMNTSIPVSVIVMTKNEERNIEHCLRSLVNFDEIFVVDSESIDRTCDVARSLGATIVQFHWNGKYPKKKQWCLDNLPFSHNYVLFVDADEQVLPELATELAELMESGPACAGYFVRYDYVFLGCVLHHGHQVYKLVFLDRRNSRFLDYDDLDAANMWEVEGHYQPQIDGPTGTLRSHMLHRDHDSLFHYFERHNRYSDWEAFLRNKGGIYSDKESQPKLRHTLKKIFGKLPMKGLVAFLHSYIFKLGFLDGRAGFHFAIARGVYYWQIGIKRTERLCKY